jgi:hypothetical protein
MKSNSNMGSLHLSVASMTISMCALKSLGSDTLCTYHFDKSTLSCATIPARWNGSKTTTFCIWIPWHHACCIFVCRPNTCIYNAIRAKVGGKSQFSLRVSMVRIIIYQHDVEHFMYNTK